ncbi:pentatricopeptide repeat-containing protein At4g18975, chloroplastic isoform X2 [Eutrema salsugineum]|uniref:pentatricopeptide repeat-containing protein At4g18975, chloroplastic isoform X2 n=1 Tax=Eutrema salsugineum TaxID=72664 RepID=UPI000CED5F3E|nr:pentatricopeptide repeat-containing protein At4g18975, chloroplastic isoform X2 [Eutrema salsugineum]
MALCIYPNLGGFSLQRLSLQLQKSQEFACFDFHTCLEAKRFGFCISAKFSETQAGKVNGSYGAIVERKEIRKVGKKEHHLWKKNDSAGSGQKALNLVRMLSGLPNEKEAVYGALNKWVAWEVEFPIIAAAKALQILRKRSQWHRVIQLAKWMLSKGQGATMGTYDTLLLAFDMEERADEAESLWNMILHTHTRSIPRRLFARMVALYAHHGLQDKVIEVFADMEELKVRPDEDTARRVARAFRELGQEEKRKLILKRYLSEFKYIYFNGERVRVKRYSSEEG